MIFAGQLPCERAPKTTEIIANVLGADVDPKEKVGADDLVPKTPYIILVEFRGYQRGRDGRDLVKVFVDGIPATPGRDPRLPQNTMY